jgi:hypothetical protein
MELLASQLVVCVAYLLQPSSQSIRDGNNFIRQNNDFEKLLPQKKSLDLERTKAVIPFNEPVRAR